MLRAIATQVCVAVMAASLDAQLFHIHRHEHGSHAEQIHRLKAVRHIHWGVTGQIASHPRNQVYNPAQDRSDEDAIFLNWFQQQASSRHPLLFVPVISLGFILPPQRPVSVAAPVPKSHDPPWSHPSGSRAPPPRSSHRLRFV